MSAIDEFWLESQSDHHAFFVPVVSEVDHKLGTWSFLDVQSVKSTPHPSRVIEVPCRLDAGEVWYEDAADKGVMAAKPYLTMFNDDASPGMCRPALTLFLRTHPDLPIQRVVAENGSQGSHTLLVMVGSPGDRAPLARELLVNFSACTHEDCPYISMRNDPSFSTALFSIPIGSLTEAGRPMTEEVIVVCLTK